MNILEKVSQKEFEREGGKGHLARGLEQKKMEMVLQYILAEEWGPSFFPLLPGERNPLLLEGKAKRREEEQSQRVPAAPSVQWRPQNSDGKFTRPSQPSYPVSLCPRHCAWCRKCWDE